jgi:hypothetical protein
MECSDWLLFQIMRKYATEGEHAAAFYALPREGRDLT